MRSIVGAALLLKGAVGNECFAGYVHKADLAGLKCMGAATDAAHCNTECCELDKNTCHGLDQKKAIECPWGYYKAGTDAWKKTPATEATKTTACCAKKATCEDDAFKCPAGEKKKAATLTSQCPGGLDSCKATCCETDAATCGGTAAADAKCEATKTAKTGADNAWKAISTVGSDFKTKCCSAVAKCDKATCPAGTSPVATPANVVCTDKDSAESANVADCNRAGTPCCAANKETCGGAHAAAPGSALKCSTGGKTESGSGSGWDAITVAAPADQAKYEAACCKTKPTCAQATCAAGTKMKKDVAKTSCTSDAASCQADCCETNDQVCGGLTGIVCPYGTFDERTSWDTTNADKKKQTSAAIMDAWKNKPGNETNKNTNCCTARVECALEGTTTPAPVVVTTTPAPALKYSAHRIATETGSERSSGANMVWLGAGAAIGMGVLMAVQGVRRMQSSEEVDEDADALLGTQE